MLPIGSQQKEKGFMTQKSGLHWVVKGCLSFGLEAE